MIALKVGASAKFEVFWSAPRNGPTRWLSSDAAIASVNEINGDNFADVDAVAAGTALLFASALGPDDVDESAVIELVVIPGDVIAGELRPGVGEDLQAIGGIPQGGTPLYPGGVTP